MGALGEKVKLQLEVEVKKTEQEGNCARTRIFLCSLALSTYIANQTSMADAVTEKFRCNKNEVRLVKIRDLERGLMTSTPVGISPSACH